MFGTVFYSGTLALYFLALIRYEVQERWFARWIEPWGHFLAIAYPLTSGIVAIVYDYFNPIPVLPGWCWLNGYPSGCSSDTNSLSVVPCERGGKVTSIMSVLAAGPLLFALVFAIILVSMLLIILKVRDTEQRLQRYAGTRDQAYERTKEVARQAILYISAFLFTYFPIGGSMFTSNSRSVSFAFALLVKGLSTFQGVFNAIIFLRNQYRALTAQGESLYFLRRIANRWHNNTSDPPEAELDDEKQHPDSSACG